MPNDAAFLELLAARESAANAAAFALETARSLAEAHRRGEQLPAVTIAETLALIERRQGQVENLRAGVARFKRAFRTH